MSKHRKILYLAAVTLLIIVVLACATQAEHKKAAPIFLQISADGKSEKIHLWEKENGVYYAFLPSYADLSEVTVWLNTSVPVLIDGRTVADGMECEIFQLAEEYDLTYSAWGKDCHDTIVFVKSGNIATMYIDTESGSMDYIHEKKGNKETGGMRLYTPNGTVDYLGTAVAVSGRGNGTWVDFKKKPYSLDLSENANLLEMGTAKRWVLLANAGDISHMRNKIVYDFARDVGLAYSPNSQWVDLYLNGEYTGLYLLCERNEVHNQRVDIDADGSFLVSLELENRLVEQGYSHVVTKANQALRIHYPNELSTQTMMDIANTIQSAENAILSENGRDPITGKSWQELIDLYSWTKKYLIEEIFCNGDACAVSQYFYYDGQKNDGKIYAGPVWDFDRSMGTDISWQFPYPQILVANRLQVNGSYSTPWFFSLCKNKIFYNQMIELYQAEFLPLLEKYLNSKLADYALLINKAVEINQIRWSGDEKDICLQTENIRAYMYQRIEFLNRMWLDKSPCYVVKVDSGWGGSYANFAVFLGEKLPDLPTLDSTEAHTFCGWYYSDTDEPFDPEKPITEDIEIYAKWEDSSNKKFEQVAKLMPLAVIAVMGVLLLFKDVYHNKKAR